MTVLDATTEAFTTAWADMIMVESAKVGITQQQADAIVANTVARHVHANQLVLDNTSESFTTEHADLIITNTSARHIHANHTILDATTEAFTVEQADEIVANTAKVGITQQQADAIVANTAKETNVTTDLSYTAAATEGTVVSSDGTDATIPAATRTLAGLLTAADQTFGGVKSFTGKMTEQVYNLTGTVIDPANGSIQYKVLSTNVTLTANFAEGQSVVLRLANGASYVVSYPTTTWVSGSAPKLTSNDVIVLWKEGATLYGSYVGSLVN